MWGGWTSEAMLARYAHLAPREVESLIQRIAPKRRDLRIVPRVPKVGHRGGRRIENSPLGGP